MNAAVADQPLMPRPITSARETPPAPGIDRPLTPLRYPQAAARSPGEPERGPALGRNVHSRRGFLRVSVGSIGLCLLAVCGISLPSALVGAPRAAAHLQRMSVEPVEVAAYYFPQYHRDARNDAWHGPNWTEWELVRRARPRYAGHGQPIVPAWGYFDQSDPIWVAREIDLAADYGITTFIYDWYWYEDGPFLQAALERGFLRAHSRNRLKFALMWANHDWLDFFPAVPNPRMLAVGEISPAAFDRMTNYVVDHFFRRPNYLTLGGEPYFSIYDAGTFINGLGGLEAAGRGLDRFRERTREAGFAGLHLNIVDTSFAAPPGQQRRIELMRLYEALGVSSLGAYAWSVTSGEGSGDGPPHVDYAALAEQMYAAWECGLSAPVPCHPNVGMGWDPSPRMSPDVPYAPRGYPWTAVVEGNTPAAFRRAVLGARDFLSRPDVRQKVLTVNAWNEWTEGSYLLPDRVHGDAYLKGLAAALLSDHSSAA